MEKVLIIDDEKFIHKVLIKMLAGEFEIKSAYEGEEGVQLANSWKPNIILLDVEMPGRSGYEVCDLLKRDKNTFDIPVIFISSRSSLRERMLGYEVGADDYLVKPCDSDELLAKIKVITQHARAKNVLRYDASNAQQTAMEAMSTSYELGKAVRFVERSYLSPDFESLGEYLMDFMRSLGLSAVAMFQGRRGNFYASSTLKAPTPLEKDLMEMMHKHDRFVDFGSRTQVNYPQVVLLVKNMPLDDRTQYGRLKDIFPFVLGATDAKVRVIDAEHALKTQSADLAGSVEAVQMTIDSIRDSFSLNMNAVSSIMSELVATLSLDMRNMGMDHDQEEYVCDKVESSAKKIHTCLQENASIETNLAEVVALLRRLNSEQRRIIDETLTVPPVEDDVSDDIELF
ncbi:response regulator [Teredinibacter sp. KSP-S5-2]|uniref:response regulator transcription factor n=1 Tax=Teredinibacter sp. KSP-S5-2 TaxID=3034506 RepID=UPI002934B087|nr:response regulator [Teredinibacter sp. KSP-S5-2]WNO10218.1 response regulator [Teredinibacter sp. KSP-S5-2]